VKLQVRIAQGEPLPFTQGDLRQRGHAIECRVYAEDPGQGFLPSPGRIVALRPPAGPGLRDDSGVYEGAEVPIHYDPLISKLVAWGADRAEAIARMRRAVSEYAVLGITTTLPFFERVLRHPAFISGDIDTGFIERHLGELRSAPSDEDRDMAVVAAAVRALRDRQSARAQAPVPAGAISAWRARAWRDLGPAR
jgi:acetyl-CoA carboxylase biotin carboxylase subunit